jgi:hypothetical protein
MQEKVMVMEEEEMAWKYVDEEKKVQKSGEGCGEIETKAKENKQEDVVQEK